MKRRMLRLVVFTALSSCSLGCATRCTLVPVETHSEQLDAWVSWDSSATPRYRIVTAIPWDDLRTHAREAQSSTSRFVLSATVQDACGETIGGHAWSRPQELGSVGSEKVFEQRFTLPTVAGPQRLTLAILLHGEAYGSTWQRTYDIPATDPQGLALEPPQFLVRNANVGNDEELKQNVSRYYDERTGPPQVRSVVHDFAGDHKGATQKKYVVEVRVLTADDEVVFEDEHVLAQLGGATPFDLELPVQGLGRHVLHLEAREGTRIATTQGVFDVGFAALADWGALDGGRELLTLLFGREATAALDATPAAERAAAWERLWEQHDPDPTTPHNEFQDDVARRIQYATVHYSGGASGWQTDRGRVYVAWGTPENVEAFQSPNSLDRTERWTYDQGDIVFVFVDVGGHGEYTLRRTNATEFLQRFREE